VRCLSCNYDLRNLPENRCPECGREFDPANPRTFFNPSRRKNRSWPDALLISLGTYLGLLFLALSFEYQRSFEVTDGSRIFESLWSTIARASMHALLILPVALILVYVVTRIIRAVRRR